MATKKKEVIIHRTRIGKDIVAEFAIPASVKHQKAGRVAVLAQGAPGMPGRSVLMTFLAKKGFYTALPRYRGSWESGGKFLEKEPTFDIKETIDALKKPLMSLYEGKSYRFPKKPSVYIFASSFGGPAGLLLSKDKRVKKVIALSPVCDWRDDCGVEPLDELDRMTKLIYGEGYRLAPNAWKKLKKGDFYNPAASLKNIDGSKVLIFHNADDDVVGIHSVKDLSHSVGATLVLKRRGGHMGLSEAMTPAKWKEIKKFLKETAEVNRRG